MITSIWIAIVAVFISSIVRRVGRRGNKNNNRVVCYFLVVEIKITTVMFVIF
jgi:hypothetical protein